MERLWHLSVFEAPAHFYIVGSDVSKTYYRLLKIGRLGMDALDVAEMGQNYSKSDIMELLSTVSEGSSSKLSYKYSMFLRSSIPQNFLFLVFHYLRLRKIGK